MKLIYVCSPVSPIKGETILSNIDKARDFCRFVLSRGHAPFASHILGLWDADDIPAVRVQALECAERYVAACDELWVFGDRVSDGMRREIDLARRLGKQVVYIAHFS